MQSVGRNRDGGGHLDILGLSSCNALCCEKFAMFAPIIQEKWAKIPRYFSFLLQYVL